MFTIVDKGFGPTKQAARGSLSGCIHCTGCLERKKVCWGSRSRTTSASSISSGRVKRPRGASKQPVTPRVVATQPTWRLRAAEEVRHVGVGALGLLVLDLSSSASSSPHTSRGLINIGDQPQKTWHNIRRRRKGVRFDDDDDDDALFWRTRHARAPA